MNRSLPVAVGLTLLLTACAGKPGFRDFDVGTGSVARASVKVVNDKDIVVNLEPIVVKQETDPSKDNFIYWSLPPGGLYWFSNTSQNPGIKFVDWKPHPKCEFYDNDKYTYVCSYKKSDGKKRYEIRVTNGTTLITSDPTVLNN